MAAKDHVGTLCAWLDIAYKRGVPHAADLALSAELRPLLDLLCPPNGKASDHQRASTAHKMIVTAVDALQGTRADAAASMLDLVPGPPGRVRGITARKEAAAHHLGISADWFSRRELEPLTLALAMELDQQIARREGRTHTDPQHHHPSQLPPPPPADSYRPRPHPVAEPVTSVEPAAANRP
ncbi:hypothetical protein [Frankia sp. AgB32]|uniref:hypothetical protein n=1 Tax=Frankia sp. AgB32 TaxID=631119 RepID=UPI00200DFA1D|nr:hypothetical protein [Frankia sp. AgB32]MCK9893368.1 hypothetical protein [Frankia sp. AgB32]